MDKSYDPESIETHWYDYWEKGGWFAPQGGERPYCIMLPPPNVTGTLHMGHAFQGTIMDLLTRYHRMQGDNTLWQPGMDHAGIATQMVVERRLADAGIHRREIGREAFIDEVWKWKEESGGKIERQMRHLGASVDWQNSRFTMDDGLSEAVSKVFISLYEEGLIYRGKRLVNWDPVLLTALSDLEVLSEEENGKLWHIRYPRRDGKGYVIVATTRPETMLGDAAVAVNPDDDRYTGLLGTELELPLCDRYLPVIADDYVEAEFGTGCVKITPAHDFNDYEIGKRHDLPMLNIFNDNATLNDNVPSAYRGMDRFAAREKIVAELEAAGLLEKVEDHRLVIPRGDRSGAIVEPYLTDQWYIKIEPLAKPAIAAVENGDIRFVPENWTKTYFEWMRNIQDWCISRQLWWGHRIPAWYDQNGNIFVGESEATIRKQNSLADNVVLRQDEDVLDTWFSSALWPFTTLGWPENTERLDTFYPTSVLVTGFDIIFFWVARMIMMGLKFTGKIPFREIYMHGLIRDSQGQKMSKSKGNVLDPLDLIHGIELEALVEKRTQGLMQPKMAPTIERATRREFPDGIQAYGTDALRFTFASQATNGRDIRFDMGRIDGYRNFCNKLWNASRYVLMQSESHTITTPETGDLSSIDLWILSRFNQAVSEVRGHIDSYRFDLASQALYELVWDEFCDWYLELSKPQLKHGDSASKNATRHTLHTVLEGILRLLHPFMPYISEEIWQRLAPVINISAATIMTQKYPEVGSRNKSAEADIEWLKQIISGLRRIRSELNLPPGKPLPLLLQGGNASDYERVERFTELLSALARIESIEQVGENGCSEECAVALVDQLQLLIPLKGLIDTTKEISRLKKLLLKEEIELKKSTGKLANKKFVANAPAAVVTQEQERLEAHQLKVDQLLEQIAKMEALA